MREFVVGSLLNVTLITALISMLIAQIVKIIYYFIIEKKINWIHLFEAGGMPSSHSALVCSLVAMVGLRQGFDSVFYAVAFVFAAIVMYDAIEVRHEEVGHTLIEVSTGGILGIIIALIINSYFRG
jgi:acid phosphatase family membrane protein YuiD